jgi:hypothetical protein
VAFSRTLATSRTIEALRADAQRPLVRAVELSQSAI